MGKYSSLDQVEALFQKQELGTLKDWACPACDGTCECAACWRKRHPDDRPPTQAQLQQAQLQQQRQLQVQQLAAQQQAQLSQQLSQQIVSAQVNSLQAVQTPNTSQTTATNTTAPQLQTDNGGIPPAIPPKIENTSL